MNLGQVIRLLKELDPETVAPEGFWEPHSYRGIYAELAFEPIGAVSVKDLLACAYSAVGETFTGYKGGEFTMHTGTRVWIANWGTTSTYCQWDAECPEMWRRLMLAREADLYLQDCDIPL